MNLDFLLDLALNASKKAGKAILNERKSLEIWKKDDGSPLSSADLASNEILCEELKKSDLAVCSEEAPLDFDLRKKLSCFWLIDPLDGTKGFLKGEGGFCVLISLILNQRPTLAVIANPSTEEFFYAHSKTVVYKNDKPLEKNETIFQANKKHALVSIHYPNPKNKDFLDKNQLISTQIGSALKFIALLEGKAGVYHRFESLHSWDLAAGDFLLNQNGGLMLGLDKNFIPYNQESFLCPAFLAVSKKEFANELIF